MKKIFILLYMTIIVILLSITATAATYGDLIYSVSNGEVMITGSNTSALGNLVIPSTIDGYPVTSIESYAFEGCKSLTSVSIPNGVTSIGGYAFCDCTNLANVSIPDSVTYMGDSAFYNTKIYNTASNWTNGVLYIGNHLMGCETTKSGLYSIRQGTKTISSKTFKDCISLTSVIIPDSVTSIGSHAFEGCKSLTDMRILNGVTSIGMYAFCDCTNLTSVTIPDSVTFIGSHAFYNSELISITIPDSISRIGYEAFMYSNLTSVTFYDSQNSNSVTTIGEDAFYYCTNLSKVYINDLSAWCGNEFDNMYANPLSNNKADLFLNSTLVTDLVIPNGVTSIGKYAFYNCTGLTSVTIPDSVTSIGEYAFYCPNISKVYIDNIASWCSIDFGDSYANPLRYDGGLYLNNSLVIDLVIPDGAKLIGKYAFYNCTGLTSVTIPDSVTSIGKYAFYNCIGLTSLTIPDSVTSIGESAFYNCTGLTEITLPFVGATKDGTSNTHFGYLFGASSYSENGKYVPSGLKKVTIAGGGSIGDNAFYDCDSLTSVSIHDSVTTVGSYAFSGCTGLESISIPKCMTEIKQGTFNNCTSITNIDIPDSVVTIGQRAFYNCKSIGCLTIESGVTSIEKEAFANLGKITSVVIPDSVTRIGNYAFSGCNSLKEITIPFIGETMDGESNTNFGYIFSSYDGYNIDRVPNSLERVVVTGGTKVADSAFESCFSIKSITLPETITSIGKYAFYECEALTEINIPEAVERIGQNILGATAFYNNSDNWENGVLYVDDNIVGTTDTIRGEYVIKDGTRVIADSAFKFCKLITKIIVPESVIFVGSNAMNAQKINYVYFEGKAPEIGSNAFPDRPESFIVIYNNSSSGFTTPTWNGYNCFPDIDLESVDKTVLNDNNVNVQGIYFTLDDDLLTATVGDITDTENNSGYYGIGYGRVIIPDYVTKGGNTYTVTAIGQSAFRNCVMLNSVYLPETVTSIGKNAFHGANNNKAFNVSESNPAFVDVDGVIFNKAKTTLRYYPAGADISTYTVPDGVLNITNGAFYGVKNLTELVLPLENQTFASIFDGSENLPSSITKVTLSGTSVYSSALYNCDTIEKIVLSDSITTVSSDAFENCDKLAAITIGKGVNYIGGDAFYRCPALETVYISDLNAWCGISFNYSDSNPLYYGAKLYLNGKAIEELVIPEGVTSISARAFYNGAFNSVTLPKTITYIGSDAFNGCDDIKKVYIGSTKSWCLIDFYNATANPLYYADDLILNGETVTTVTVPDGISTINRYAFLGYEKLTSISFPDSITSIYSSSFSGCTSLKLVELSENTVTIGENAFSECSNLVKLVIPTKSDNVKLYTSAIPEWTTIYGISGSAVQGFADTNGYSFVPITDKIYSIRYNANGGENAPVSGTKGVDTDYILSKTIPTKKNAIFAGWSIEKNGEVAYRSGDGYSANASITLWAVWLVPEIIVDDTSCASGRTFTVDVAIANNTGLKSVDFEITYPKSVQVVNVQNGVALSTLDMTMIGSSNLVKVSFVGDVADTTSGIAMTLTFKVNENATEGVETINVAVTDARSGDSSSVEISDKIVNLTIKSYIPGDINGDGITDLKDVTTLRRHLAGGYNVTVVDAALDVNNDGVVDLKDVTYLRRALAGGYGIELK